MERFGPEKEDEFPKLTRESVDKNPIIQFSHWFDEVLKAGIPEPNAMILSTSNEDNQPSQRTVLLKYFDEKGLVFFTNYHSRKSQQIQKNPAVSILFPWYQMSRQVVISGTAEKIGSLESARYFLSRPHGSQLGAWVSHQSKVVSSRSLLEQKMNEIKQKFSDGKVPVPDFWGGYRIVPSTVEFWQGRKDRLHDRIFFSKRLHGWQISRLSP